MANERGKQAGRSAYDLIVEAIEKGELAPGTRLREIELALRFGISRTPIREALKKLEVHGLVTHEAHHGAIVAQLDHGAVTELYTMREVLEGTAARLAAIHATATEVELLRHLLDEDRRHLGDSATLAANNRMFHAQIHQSARNRYLLAMVQNLRTSLAILAGTTLAEPDRGAAALAEHERMVDAIEARDGDSAENHAREHIRRAFGVRLRQRLREHSDTHLC